MGRKVAGGKFMGRIDGFEASKGFETRIGCTGVLNAGEDEGMGLGFADIGPPPIKGAERVGRCLLDVSMAHTIPSANTSSNHIMLSDALNPANNDTIAQSASPSALRVGKAESTRLLTFPRWVLITTNQSALIHYRSLL